MSVLETLASKEKELIAIAVSIAYGFLPSTIHHIKSARNAGATEFEVHEAIALALTVRNNATKIITDEQSVNDIVLMGAALASNSVAGLEYYLTATTVAGTSVRQSRTVIKIARAIRKEAAEKAS